MPPRRAMGEEAQLSRFLTWTPGPLTGQFKYAVPGLPRSSDGSERLPDALRCVVDQP